MDKVVMGFSGGLDSTALMGHYLENQKEVHGVVFNYGSKHGEYERRAAWNIAGYYERHFPNKVTVHEVDIRPVMGLFSSGLLLFSAQDIPEGRYDVDNMKQTVVPGRNLIFASILAGIAESIGAGTVALGIHSGDHHVYPDCRVDFAKALDTTIYLSSGGQVQVEAPFAFKHKSDIVWTGLSLAVPAPFHLTRSCYKNQEIACGKCGTCQERLEAFEKIGIPDPVPYNTIR